MAALFIMNSGKPLIFFTLLILSRMMVSGQDRTSPIQDAPLRIEVNARSVNETYRVIPAGEHGVVLFYRSTEAGDPGRTNWYFTCYDTNLQQTWVKSVPLPNEHDLRFRSGERDTIALLFTHAGKPQSGYGGFSILRIIPGEGTLLLNEGELAPDAPVTAFRVLHDNGWMAIAREGSPDLILRIRLSTGVQTSIATGQGESIRIRWIEPDPENGLLHAIVTRRLNRKSTEHFFVTWDSSGVVKREILLATLDNGKEINQVRASRLGTGEFLVAGTFGKQLTGSAQKTNPTGESAGFFTLTVLNDRAGPLAFHNFLTLNSISEMVGAAAAAEHKRKAAKRSTEMDEYSVDLSIILNELTPHGDHYILGAEVFEPQYHTENFTDFDFYGRPYTNTYSVFDGYRYRHAMAVAFSAQGQLVWDNVIEIRNLVSHDLSPRILSFFSGDELVMCYLTDGRAATRIMKENQVTEKLGFAPLDLLYQEDKLINESKGKLQKWYGNYYIASGYQEIKNISLETGNKRLVYYFSKVKFER